MKHAHQLIHSVTGLSLIIFMAGCQQPAEKTSGVATPAGNYSANGKKAMIYTTADTANYRLTLTTDTLTFRPMG